MELPYIRYTTGVSDVANKFSIEEIKFGIEYLDGLIKSDGDVQSIKYSLRFDLETMGIAYYNDAEQSTAYFSTHEVIAIKNRLLMALKKNGKRF